MDLSSAFKATKRTTNGKLHQPMNFRQIDPYSEHSKGVCFPIGGLLMLPEEFTRRFGVSFVDADLEDGLGPAQIALIETASGRYFGLVHYEHHPEPRGISVWTDKRSLTPATDLRDFMNTFALVRQDFLGAYESDNQNDNQTNTA